MLKGCTTRTCGHVASQKQGVGPPGLQIDRGRRCRATGVEVRWRCRATRDGGAKRHGWSCRATGVAVQSDRRRGRATGVEAQSDRGGGAVELQSVRGGVAERQGWSCRASEVELQSVRGGVEVVVSRPDAWIAKDLGWKLHTILAKMDGMAQHLG